MSNIIRCRRCGVRKSCRLCFESSTIAAERLQNGEQSGECKVCFDRRSGKSDEQIKRDHREIAYELGVR